MVEHNIAHADVFPYLHLSHYSVTIVLKDELPL